MTVEDPIEYYIDGVGQTQVNTRVDMTFARGLRAILRQDPDVVMVGEIRDLETAEIAVQASLTGHLVLSTLHTNSAVGAVARLRDMGVEPFLLVIEPDRRARAAPRARARSGDARSVSGDTRRTRRVRQASRHAGDAVSAKRRDERVAERWPPRGLQGPHRHLRTDRVDETMRRLIHEGASEADLERHARTRSGAMLEDGWRKCIAGVTSTEEVLRVTREE